MLSISSSAPAALPSAPPSSAQVSSTASSSNNKYDPVYCLSEHLDYFSESVADLLAGDFDVIFGGSEEAQQVAASSACVPQVSSLAETANGYTQYSKKLRLASPQDEPFRLPSVQEVVSASSCSTTQSMTQQMSTFPTILAPKPMKVPNPILSFMTASPADSSTTAAPVSIAPYMVSPVSSVSKSITSNLYGTTGMVTPLSSNGGFGLVSASNSDDESAMNNATTTTNKPSAAKKSRKRQINTADVSEEESVLSTLPSKNTGRKLDKGEREDVRRYVNDSYPTIIPVCTTYYRMILAYSFFLFLFAENAIVSMPSAVVNANVNSPMNSKAPSKPSRQKTKNSFACWVSTPVWYKREKKKCKSRPRSTLWKHSSVPKIECWTMTLCRHFEDCFSKWRLRSCPSLLSCPTLALPSYLHIFLTAQLLFTCYYFYLPNYAMPLPTTLAHTRTKLSQHALTRCARRTLDTYYTMCTYY